MTLDEFSTIRKGDILEMGKMLPFEGEQIVAETLSVGTGTRQTKERPTTHEFKFADFRLTYLGIEVARLLAEEQDDGTIAWRAEK